MNIKYCYILFILVCLFTFNQCKSAKTIANTGALDKSLSVKQILKNSAKNASTFNTLNARLKIETTNGSKQQSVGVTLRMERNKTIYMSKLGIVKALITPNRVAFYNKLDGTYFDGDYAYLSDILGIPLDFYKLQDLLTGAPIFKPTAKEYSASVFEKSYLLKPKNQNELFELFLMFNPNHFKLNAQEISQSETNRILKIDYPVYQTVANQIVPEQINILALEDGEEFKITLEFANVSINENLRFPFKIPSGFKKITLK